MTSRSRLEIPLARFLSDAAGAIRRFELEETTISLDDDLVLAAPIRGGFDISRTNRGIFVRGDLTTALAMECSRCLTPTTVPLEAAIREEVLLAIDPSTGQALDRTAEPDVARLTDHHDLDLEPLLREAISLSTPIAPICRPDCPGLCIDCGERLGDDHPAHEGDDIDPRLAALRGFKVDGDAQNE